MNRRKFLECAAFASAAVTLAADPARAEDPMEPEAPLHIKMDNPEFAVRGLEIHSRRMWTWRAIESAFQLMEQTNLNMLVLHQDDLQDAVVWPEKYFPNDVRSAARAIQGAHDRAVFLVTAQEYLRNIVKEAKRRGITVFIEVCELWYPEGLTELHPEVLGAKGTICPTHSFWWDFTRDKYKELFDVVPDLGGVIVSPGTLESKVSIAMKTCDCPSCSTVDAQQWYINLIGAMFESIDKAGKTLVVRDFAYTKADQTLVMDAAKTVSPKIVAALKNTPHDFYPTFPNNPRIGHVGGAEQWIEFDCWGQFYGCGVFPCGVVEDMQRRLQYARSNGAKGAWFRTDLESMTDASTFNSFNQLNLIAGAMLSQRTTLHLDDIYRSWLEWGLYDSLGTESMQMPPVPLPASYVPRLRAFMQAAWSVIEKSYYVRGFLFVQNGMYFDSVDNAFFMALHHHGRADWEPGANARIDPTEENISAIIAEKDQALAEVAKLSTLLDVDTLPIPPAMKAHLQTVLTLYVQYVKGFRVCAIGYFRTKQAKQTTNAHHKQLALGAADEIARFRAGTAEMLGDQFFPHYVYRAFDLNRLDRLVADIRATCASIAS